MIGAVIGFLIACAIVLAVGPWPWAILGMALILGGAVAEDVLT